MFTDWAHDIDNCRRATMAEAGAIAALRRDEVAMENMIDSAVGEEWNFEVVSVEMRLETERGVGGQGLFVMLPFVRDTS